MWWEVALIGAMLAAVASVAVGTLRTGVPPMPTLPAARRVLLDALPGAVSGTVYELGAGWGGLAVALARRYPQQPVVACEWSFLPWLVCRVRKALLRRPNLRVERVDCFARPIADAGLVVCYLDPDAMLRLRDKLHAETQPGTWLVSHAFAVPGWQPTAAHHRRGFWSDPVYTYRVPARRPGALR